MNSVPKKVAILAIVACLTIIVANAVPNAKFHQARPEKYSILLVGNSLTYYNDLPNLLSAIASTTTPDIDVSVHMLAESGVSLSDHFNYETLAQLLAAHKYSAVVFQDVGAWPLCRRDDDQCNQFEESLARMIMLARSSGARPIWFSTWHRSLGAQKALTRHAVRISRELDVSVADVGAAFFFHEGGGSIDRLLLEDGHPNKLGTLITAATIYRTIHQERISTTSHRNIVVDQRDWTGYPPDGRRLANTQLPPESVQSELSGLDIQRAVKAANAVARSTYVVNH